MVGETKHEQGEGKDDPRGLTMLNPIWGQFITHDILLTPVADTETIKI